MEILNKWNGNFRSNRTERKKGEYVPRSSVCSEKFPVLAQLESALCLGADNRVICLIYNWSPQQNVPESTGNGTAMDGPFSAFPARFNFRLFPLPLVPTQRDCTPARFNFRLFPLPLVPTQRDCTPARLYPRAL